MNEFKNNLKKIMFVTDVIHNKIKFSKINKKNFLNKFKKTNDHIFNGMNNSTLINKVITYTSPFDKTISLEFKTIIDIDDVMLEQNKKIDFTSNYNNSNISIDDLIIKINSYIQGINKLSPNIYQEFDFIINKNNQDELNFNHLNKFIIITWNLELKKYFCLIWKVLENLYLEFDQYKKNISYSNYSNVVNFVEEDLNNSSFQIYFNNFGTQINMLIILMIEIKKIFESIDDNKYLLAANTIDTILDKYLFILNFISKNLVIISK
jgi:hypothetical protein